ncbi:MAG: hypothetical protein E6J39_03075 [Chloroflexi bacterium]|nr:MAG: hypothetical protein E6J39_03075 [Chloroflexota bacterium]
MRRLRERLSDKAEGQVLVIVAVGFIVLLGFAGLVIDIGMADSTQRYERSIVDASSLAGAQQLQLAGTRQVGAAQYADARTVAMQNLVNEVAPGASTPACTTGGSAPYPADVVRCAIPNTPYRVSIRAPSPVCISAGCDISRSVLVSVTRLNLPTIFARLFGQSGWDVSQAAVAGLHNIGKYAVITLRPPKPQKNGSDANFDDISVKGTNTLLQVIAGDIGTNTNLNVTGGGAVTLDIGFDVHHFDTYLAWTPPPTEEVLPTTIADPNYAYPTRTGAPTYSAANLSDARDSAANCALQQLKVPLQYTVGGTPIKTMLATNVSCYKPGIYTQQLSNAHNNEAILLEPGLYFFDAGVKLGVGAFVGGYEAGNPGVALVFNECNSGCVFDGNNSPVIALNGGTKFNNANGQEATAAVGFDSQPVQTNAGFKPSEIPITLLVEKDPNCVVADEEPGSCNDNANNTLNIAGNGALYLAGAQYAPTDNIKISGGSAGTGYVGQIVGWTVTYSGGSTIKQTFPANLGVGVLRLDASCSGTDSHNASCYP